MSAIPDLRRSDLIIVTSSAGKDSMAMLAEVVRQAEAAGVRDRIVVVHNDLGKTDKGLSFEWPGTRMLAWRQASHYGLRFIVTRRERGGLFQQIRARRKFPSATARYCTSDQKTSQTMKVLTRLVRETGITHRQVRIAYCVGLRAQESPGRAKKPRFAHDRSASNGKRSVTRAHPILDWSTEKVWAEVKSSGMPYHPAYDLGMSRLSCTFCVLASLDDLILAAQLRPDVAAEIAELEIEIGHRFTAAHSMAEIIELAATRPMPKIITPIQPRPCGLELALAA